jgi:aspartate 1-decarboxylase
MAALLTSKPLRGPAIFPAMYLTLCKAKLHRATVTQAELHYEGSITIDAHLLDSAGIVPFERVQVVDVNNGNRFETYAIAGNADAGVICVNGAAARLVHPGDHVIIIAYAQYTPDEAKRHQPVIVLLDAQNRVRERITADQSKDIAILSESD